MSEQKSQLAVIPAEKLEALDRFANENNLSVLTEGKGSFTAAIAVADAIGQLKAMLTPEVMQPIMKLQGTALGFKTDKDNAGGYPVETVRECFIEGTLKGFKFVGNQSNIIAGRFYATKEGFEDFFLRQAKLGNFTDYRDAYSIPKHTSENEAIVTCSASWKWKGNADKFENVPISIRVNKGQGADAILGKAKRKLLARIYSRVTGTVITEGEAGEAVDIQATPVPESGKPADLAPEKPSEDQIQLLKEIITAEIAPKADAWLKSQKLIPETGSYLDVSAKLATKIISNPKGFLSTIGAE